MYVTDPIADMLTRIRNANMARHATVEVPASRLKAEIARILKAEGYIEDCELYEDTKGFKAIKIKLRYDKEKRRMLTGLRRISKPGLRVYVGKTEIPRVLGGFGVAILSTPAGILTDKQARRKGIGGEVMCYVW